MANPYKLTLDTQGVSRLLHSDEMESACFDAAQQKAADAGADYYAQKSGSAGDRTGAVVKSDSVKEYYRNLNSNYILKKLGLWAYSGKRGHK